MHIKFFVLHNAHKQIIQASHKHSFKQAGIHSATDYNNAAQLLRVGRNNLTTGPYDMVFRVSVFNFTG